MLPTPPPPPPESGEAAVTREGCGGETKPANPSPGYCFAPFRMEEAKFRG